MADQPENSGQISGGQRPSSEVLSAVSDSAFDADPSSLDTHRSGGKRYSRRGRHRTHRYEALRRSQIRLGWALATGTLTGILLGMLFGNLMVGTGIGLTLGLAVGLLISG